MIEIIGILASVIVLISFLMKNINAIRLINILGAILFVIYGIMIKSVATWFLNGALIIIHFIYLIKSKKE